MLYQEINNIDKFIGGLSKREDSNQYIKRLPLELYPGNTNDQWSLLWKSLFFYTYNIYFKITWIRGLTLVLVWFFLLSLCFHFLKKEANTIMYHETRMVTIIEPEATHMDRGTLWRKWASFSFFAVDIHLHSMLVALHLWWGRQSEINGRREGPMGV